jgi:hypothetical protein
MRTDDATLSLLLERTWYKCNAATAAHATELVYHDQLGGQAVDLWTGLSPGQCCMVPLWDPSFNRCGCTARLLLDHHRAPRRPFSVQCSPASFAAVWPTRASFHTRPGDVASPSKLVLLEETSTRGWAGPEEYPISSAMSCRQPKRWSDAGWLCSDAHSGRDCRAEGSLEVRLPPPS